MKDFRRSASEIGEFSIAPFFDIAATAANSE
jgi:hypothetical protein